jgi:molybdopterin-guanine dinucleotide biosynthesis protein A
MGRSKVMLPFGPETMLGRVARLLSQAVDVIVVVAAAGQELPELPPSIILAHDRQPDRGPLEGLAVGLRSLAARWGVCVNTTPARRRAPESGEERVDNGEGPASRPLSPAPPPARLVPHPSPLAPRPSPLVSAFVTACDVPLLKPAFVRRMLELSAGHEIAVPHVGGFDQPLAAVYHLSVLPHVETLLAADRLRPAYLFDRVRTRRVTAEELTGVDPELQSLANVNSPEDYRAILRLAGFPHEASSTVAEDPRMPQGA